MSQEFKKVLITGSSTGIGIACLKKFLENNWNILAHYYEDNEEFKSICTNSNVEPVQADFQSDDEINSFLDHLEKTNITALVNSAGCFDFSIDSKDRINSAKNVFCVNTIVPFLIAEKVIKKMKLNNYGNIVNVSSIGVKFGSGLESVFYGASKSALEPITRSLAREGAKNNILVNTLRPGITNTDFYDKIGKNITDRVKLIPLGRAAEASEIAEVIYFLCNDNTFITGQIIAIDGGVSLE